MPFIHLKIKRDDDVRRISIDSKTHTLTELSNLLQALFGSSDYTIFFVEGLSHSIVFCELFF